MQSPNRTERFECSWSLDARDEESARRVQRELSDVLVRRWGVQSNFLAVELILAELLGNVARHTPGNAFVRLEHANGTARLEVAYRGSPIESDGSEAPDVFAEGGRGLFLVRNLSRRFEIERHKGHGNVVCVDLPVVAENRF